MNREHRERDGKQANSSRPRAQPVVAVGVGAAMAGGESSRAHVKRGLRAMKLANNRTGRKRGGRGSHRGEKRRRRRLGDGCSRGGRTADPGDARAVSSCTGERERERGNNRGKRLGQGFLFVEAGAQGMLPRRHGTWARRQFRLDRRGRGTRGRRETAPTGGPRLAAAEGGAKGARQRLPPEWAGPGREEGEGERAAGMKKANWAGSEEGMERKEEILFLFIFRVFQKYFSNGFEFLFSNLVKPIIPKMNMQQHVCIKRLLTL